MRCSMLLVLLLLIPALGLAQDDDGAEEPPVTIETPLELAENARVLYVARQLNLRDEQIEKITPLLNTAQDALSQRDRALDAVWAAAQPRFAAVAQAIMAGQAPDRAAQQAVEKAIADHDNIRQHTDRALEDIAAQVLALLDQAQVAQVERPQAGPGPSPGADVAAVVQSIGAYATAMRTLQPDEYEMLRVPIAMRLAGRLVAPNDRGYDNAVGGVLRVLDTVRRMTDAQFADNEAKLPQAVVLSLGLPQEPVPQATAFTVSFADLIVFVTNPRTARLLQDFEEAAGDANGAAGDANGADGATEEVAP